MQLLAEQSVDIACPVAAVYDYATNLEHFGEWFPGVIGVVSKDKQDFYAASRLIRYGQVDLAPLIDVRYPLEELRAAMEHAIQPGTYRVIVEA